MTIALSSRDANPLFFGCCSTRSRSSMPTNYSTSFSSMASMHRRRPSPSATCRRLALGLDGCTVCAPLDRWSKCMAEASEQQQEKLDDSMQPPMPQDWLLRMLVRQANDYAQEMGITLYVGGLMVSGLLIGHVRYLELLSEVFRSAHGSGRDSAIAIGDELKKASEAEKTLSPEDKNDPHFIHLRDVRFLSPGQPTTNGAENLIWRGRLACVDAWSLGAVQ
jgi:hypothetical protein